MNKTKKMRHRLTAAPNGKFYRHRKGRAQTITQNNFTQLELNLMGEIPLQKVLKIQALLGIV